MMTKAQISESLTATIDLQEIYSADSEKAGEYISNTTKKRTEPVDWDLELQWLQENQWVLEKYRGAWVAIKAKKLVAHDVDYHKLQAFCEKKNIKNPFIQYIPTSEHEWGIGLGNYVILENFSKNG